MNRFEDQVAIVTGGAGWIGRAVARRLAQEGSRVALADIDQSKLEEVSGLLAGEGHKVIGVQTDVTDRGSVRNMVDAVLSEWGKIDVLVNVAGGARNAAVEEMSEEIWRDAIDLNLTGTFYCIQAVVKHMADRGGGKIVNTSSTAKDGVPWYKQANIGRANYSAANAGLIGLTNALSLELADHHINVNTVVPGPVKNPRNKESFEQLEADERVTASPLTLIPLGRYGTPEDVAKAVAFLASEDADFVTGHSLYVSGGL